MCTDAELSQAYLYPLPYQVEQAYEVRWGMYEACWATHGVDIVSSFPLQQK
jgi:hypothetical protein